MDNRVFRCAGLLLLSAAILTGCASTPATTTSAPPPAPATVLIEARAAVDRAQAGGHAVDDALVFLRQADQAMAAGDEEKAAALAEQAKLAVAARLAIDGARPEVERAVKEAGARASDAVKVLDAAEAALKAGDPVRATELATQARQQAADAVAQMKAERERSAAAASYVVVRGDSLWRIAGRKQVYGNALHWPLLFRANRNRIQDPDLIVPGQRLTITRPISAADQAAAVRHAHRRGPWKLGPQESSDRQFLGD